MRKGCRSQPIIAVLFAVMVSVAAGGCQSENDTDDDESQQEQASTSALRSNIAAQRAVRQEATLAFFDPPPRSAANGANLAELRREASRTDLVLAAAWKALKSELRDAEARGETIEEGRKKVDEFLSLLRKRSSISTPKRWINSFDHGCFLFRRDCELYGWDYRYPNAHEVVHWQDHTLKSGAKIRLSDGINLRETTDSTIEISKGKNKVTFARSILDSGPWSANGYMRIEFAETKVYLALFDGVGWDFPLICIDLRTGKPIWQRLVRGFNSGTALGLWWHDLHIDADSDRVDIFGKGVYHYIERFDVETGESQFRFSTRS